MPNSPDDPSLSPWLPREPIAARRLDDWQSKCVMTIRTGPGLLSNRKGNSVSIALATPGPKVPAPVALVSGTGNESGGGKYTGVIIDRPATAPAATGNLSGAELGTAGTVIRIVNTREEAQGTHDLVWDGSRYPLAFQGLYRGTDPDGVPVYAIDGFQWKDCT